MTISAISQSVSSCASSTYEVIQNCVLAIIDCVKKVAKFIFETLQAMFASCYSSTPARPITPPAPVVAASSNTVTFFRNIVRDHRQLLEERVRMQPQVVVPPAIAPLLAQRRPLDAERILREREMQTFLPTFDPGIPARVARRAQLQGQVDRAREAVRAFNARLPADQVQQLDQILGQENASHKAANALAQFTRDFDPTMPEGIALVSMAIVHQVVVKNLDVNTLPRILNRTYYNGHLRRMVDPERQLSEIQRSFQRLSAEDKKIIQFAYLDEEINPQSFSAASRVNATHVWEQIRQFGNARLQGDSNFSEALMEYARAGD